MNILFICGYSASYGGNFIQSLLALSEENKTAEEGNSCFLFPQKTENKQWIDLIRECGYPVFFMKKGIKNEKDLVKEICLKNRIDLIYHHFWNIYDCIAAHAVCKKNKRIANVIHHHNEYHSSVSPIREWMKRRIMNADLHIGCGEKVTKGLSGADMVPAVCIDNCIDFKHLDEYRTITKRDNALKFLTFSSYSYEAKGIDISIKAMQDIEEKYNVELVIVAADNWNEIKKKVSEECGGSIPEWISILPGISDVASYYHAADVYLNASRTEGFCYATIEAIYCGCQIIQSDTKGNRLDVPDTFVFESENVTDLSDKIVQFINQTEQERILQKQKQQEYILQKYPLNQWVGQEMRELKRIYEEKHK